MAARNWILLRGLARHSAHWGYFRQRITEKFPSDHFEFMDARGNGEFQNLKSFTKIADFVNELRLRSKFIARGEKVNLLTISMGGMMAMEWVHRHPEEVNKVICINTSDGGTSPFWQRLRPGSYFPLLNVLINNSDPVKREELTLDLITNLLKNKKEVAQIFSSYPVTTRENFLRQLYAASQYEFPVENPPRPTLLLASEKDRLVSPQCTKKVASMWKLTPQFHPTAGHDIPLDDPEWLLNRISDFMEVH